MIELEEFSKRYDKKSQYVVENINLKALPGKVTALLGLNGQGKTTIIKAICGIHFASKGKVLISNGEEKLDISLSNGKAKRMIGYMSENPIFPENLTVVEYLRFSKSMFAPYNCDKEISLKEILKECALDEVQNCKIKKLSKGFRQRLNLAQALLHNPENIVLDEPVNGLDPLQIMEFRKVIKKLSANKTLLLSTHLMQEVEALCDNLYILSQGKIAFSGTKEELLETTHTNSLDKAFLEITSNASVEDQNEKLF
ncbi:MAG: ABC transporter ATP-binding protein [Treponema sp.]|nr:ABC transporter ATP-binding protein [Treponema sp.]